MKKTYLNPSCKYIEFKSEGIMNGTGNAGPGGGPGAGGPGGPGDGGGDINQFNVWGDDEEE
jgi:hypothetical protein